MLETLPQWMQDAWPWILWIGGVGAVITLFGDQARRSFHRKKKEKAE
jgi:hypothetical protein